MRGNSTSSTTSSTRPPAPSPCAASFPIRGPMRGRRASRWKCSAPRAIAAAGVPLGATAQQLGALGDLATNAKGQGARLLTPGMFVRIRLPIGQPHPALLVVDRAVGSDQGLKFVYVLDKDNKVQYRRVTTGPLEDDGLRSHREGLEKGDWVITGALQQVRPRMQVRAGSNADADRSRASAVGRQRQGATAAAGGEEIAPFSRELLRALARQASQQLAAKRWSHYDFALLHRSADLRGRTVDRHHADRRRWRCGRCRWPSIRRSRRPECRSRSAIRGPALRWWPTPWPRHRAAGQRRAGDALHVVAVRQRRLLHPDRDI